MKALSALAAPLTLIMVCQAAEPAPVVKPPELQAVVDSYESGLQPLETTLQTKISERAKKYAADLGALEPQVASTGQGEVLQALRAERAAYAEGLGTAGFDPEEKRIPPAARELRRIYDRDIAKLRADALPAAKPLAASYLQKLTDLEKKFIASRNADGVLATQAAKREMQDAMSDPLYGGDKIVVGEWKGLKFGADGSLKTSGVAKGKWQWVNRSKRALLIDFQPSWAKDITYTLTPDGMGLIGKDTTGAAKSSERAK